MPKYYRFRPNTRPKKLKRKEREVMEERLFGVDKEWLDLLPTPVKCWYIRRTAWRDPLYTFSTLQKLFVTGLHALKLGDRSVIPVRSIHVFGLLIDVFNS